MRVSVQKLTDEPSNSYRLTRPCLVRLSNHSHVMIETPDPIILPDFFGIC